MPFIFFAFTDPGDKDKFELVYNRFKRLMLSKAYDILRDYGLAEDAVSEAFIRAYKNLHKIGDPESGRTAAFLVMITQNTAITILNRQKRAPVGDTEEHDEADSYNLEEDVIERLGASELMDVIGTLKEELRTPFLMRYAYDMPVKDIAKALKITENNTAVRIKRAKDKLARMLAPDRNRFA